MPIFCQTTSFLSKTHCYHFIFFFFKFSTRNPPAVMAIFGQKAVNSVKSTLFYGPKKVNRTPFFSIFLRRNQCSHAHSLSCPISKKTVFLCPYFVQKPHSLRNTVLLCHLTKLFMKTPCSHYHISSKKHHFCQNDKILW